MTETKTEPKAVTITQNKKVRIVPITERNNPAYDKNHDGAFMYTHAEMSFDLPNDITTGRKKIILTLDEQKEFEKVFQLEPGKMSLYNKDSEFWSKFRVKLTKEGLTLDLNDPMDALKLRVLKANKVIAPSWNERLDDAKYKFAIEEEDTVLTNKVKKADTNLSAYKHFGKIEDSISQMKNVLRLAGKVNIPNNADINFYKTEIEGLITQNAQAFIDIVTDGKFNIKTFIEDAVDCKAIVKVGRTGYKFVGQEDSEKFANNITEAIEFFETAHNQDLYLKVKAQINNKK